MKQRIPTSEGMFAFGPFLLLPMQRALLENGQPVRLGSRSLDILIALVERAGEVVSKEELIARVWPSAVVDEGALRVHMVGLRRALGEVRSDFRYIGNVPSRGYCFIAPIIHRIATDAAAETPPCEVPATARAAKPLPLPATRLIGRDETVDTLVALLPQRRLVTLVGPGGMGKTTVALAAAARRGRLYADGVHFVDFSALTDPVLVGSTVVAVLGVPSHSDDPLKDLSNWLSDKSALLVLDNCEHVLPEAAALAERLLAAAPHSHLLATSREPLRARGEWVHRLPALSAPPAGTSIGYAEALSFPAFELFVERALASFDGAGLSDADVPQVAHLCRHLDGIPLAIELVAAQVGFYGVRGLVTMLEDRLTLAMMGRRTAQPRHQTLRGTLDWSHDLLSSGEQRLLRRLSVFRERFTLQGAMAVAGERALDTAHLLMNLVSKSLVASEPGDGEVAYRLLETTRAYAAEKLAAVQEEQQDVFRRHAGICLAGVQLATSEFEGRVPERWRARHCGRIDDVRAALRWSLCDRGDPELGARLAADAAALYFGLWLVREYMHWLERARAGLPADAVSGRLDMQLSLEYGQTCLAMRGGAIESLDALARSAALAGQLSERGCQLSALWGCFSAHLLRGDYRAALADTEHFGQVARDGGDTRAVFAYHRMMALCLHFLGDQAVALAHAQSSLTPASLRIGQLHGNTYQLDHRTAALTQLARILWLQGRAGEAMRAAGEAIDAAVEADHALSLTYTLAYAACPIALWSGDDDASRRHVDALQDCADAHSLVFWQSWGRLYREVLSRRLNGAPGDRAAPGIPLHFSQADMLVTLHADFVDGDAIARAEAGLSPWCAPEVLRVQAERSARAGDVAALARSRHLLLQAFALAERQGAHAWSLRCALSFARLHGERSRDEARQRLAEAVACMDGTDATSDLCHARALLGRWPAEPDARSSSMARTG